MRWTYRAVCLVGIVLLVCACGGTEVAASEGAGGGATAPGQIPNLLQKLVEGVQRALEDLRDSLREQFCGRCPAAASVLVLASVLAAGRARPR